MSTLNKYTWSFMSGDEGDLTHFSCVTTSVAAAREALLDRIRRIAEAQDEYARITSNARTIPITQFHEQINALIASFGVDSFIYSWRMSINRYTTTLMVRKNWEEAAVTLHDFITTTEPSVKPFECVSLCCGAGGD